MSDAIDEPCKNCGRTIGDHTVREMRRCAADSTWVLPHERVPGGPLYVPETDNVIVGHVGVASAVVRSSIGPSPALRFTFDGPTSDGGHLQHGPFLLVMTEEGIANVRRLVINASSMAIKAARQAR